MRFKERIYNYCSPLEENQQELRALLTNFNPQIPPTFIFHQEGFSFLVHDNNGIRRMDFGDIETRFFAFVTLSQDSMNHFQSFVKAFLGKEDWYEFEVSGGNAEGCHFFNLGLWNTNTSSTVWQFVLPLPI